MLQADFELDKKQAEIALLTKDKQLQQTENKRARIFLFALLGGVASLVVFTIVLFRNNQQKQKANRVLEQTLQELKAAQSLLIQQEKMASLGQLTAGIAHEIQNPLNFVNNFSDISKELLDEVKDEIDKGNLADSKEIANSVIENVLKINHHGKRADAIVKGMLEHSRSGSGVKEKVDINKLVDEYLRIAYHGQSAKDKSFRVALHTNYDAHIGRLDIVAQDIGRVILNLVSNAFFAVTVEALNGKTGTVREPIEEPAVWVSTKKAGNKISISIKDNGCGVPEKIIDKIFQPFFTTKPAGQGTGLGLSLSYDIVKAHGGELKIATVENKFTEFVIELPVK